jgi:hypothetical protein
MINIWRSNSTFEFVKNVRRSSLKDVITIEEVSVLFPSRRAMAGDNVDMGAIFDTIRKKQLVIISNCPIWGSLDSHMRALGHVLVETLSVLKSKGVVVSKFHRLQTNPRSGITYFHPFQRNGKDVIKLFTRMPDKETWIEYEKEKDEFMDNLYTKLEHRQKKKIDKERKEMGLPPEKSTDRKPLTAIQEQTMQVLANHTYTEASKILGKKTSTLHECKTLAEKKGYTLEEFRNNAIGEEEDGI